MGEADSLKKPDRLEARWIEVDNKKLRLEFRRHRFGLGERFDRARPMMRRKLLQGGSDRRG
jgi:hypothetical protein